MTDIFVGRAIALRGVNSGTEEELTYDGLRRIQIETDQAGFTIENIDVAPGGANAGAIAFLDGGSGNAIPFDAIEAGTITLDAPGGGRTTTSFMSFFDEQANATFDFLLVVDGPGLPTPAVGSNFDQFLQGFNAEIALGTGRFALGQTLEFQEVAGLTLQGGGASIGEAANIALLYDAALDRNGNVDAGGLNFWIDRLEAGASEKAIAFAFLDNPEFIGAFGNATDPAAASYLSDEELIRQLYRNVLDREGDQGGITFWLNQLARPEVDRADMLLAFADSAENRETSSVDETITEITEGEWIV